MYAMFYALHVLCMDSMHGAAFRHSGSFAFGPALSVFVP